MKILILLVLISGLLSSQALAIGKIEKGIIIGAASVFGIHQILKNRDDKQDSYYDREYYPVYPVEGFVRRGPECVWVTQYHPYTREPVGYIKYCR